MDSVYDINSNKPTNARNNNVELKLDNNKLQSKEFKELWSRINTKSVYVVNFDEDELIKKAIDALNKDLLVSKILFKVESGSMTDIKSREQLKGGDAFNRNESEVHTAAISANSAVKYDLIGKVVAGTELTRKSVVAILSGIEKGVFEQFSGNPEEFILKTAAIINEQKATAIIQHITYNKLNDAYDTNIFTEPTIKGQLGVNAMSANKHLYDHIIYDSENEKKFADEIDINNEVAVYVKLLKGFYINTPVGKYNPDWAIAFHDGKVKHIYFVAETKGSMRSLDIRPIENAKIHCAREHFKAISSNLVVYDVIDSFDSLLNKVMK